VKHGKHSYPHQLSYNLACGVWSFDIPDLPLFINVAQQHLIVMFAANDLTVGFASVITFDLQPILFNE